jgi:UDP-N-acetylglucosamine/UDP-N-acetylgalactosamine diphosphorylase
VARERPGVPTIEALRDRFEEYGQGHVFRFWDRLDDAGREALRRQAGRIALPALIRAFEATRVATHHPGVVEPLDVVAQVERGGDPAAWAEAEERGRALLAEGRVAMMVVAGGQATRLGYAGPKGDFPLGPVTGRTLFAQQAQKIRALRRHFGQPIPWYVMTSEATDSATRRAFEAAGYFDLPEGDVFFLRQGMVPGFDFQGKLLLERPDRVFENPNGHGGSLIALLDSGALDDMTHRGIDTIFYYQVDNPLVPIGDPAFLGFHALARAEISCKVLRKREPGEKVGVVARVDGRPGVVEYTEISDEHRHARDENGELVFWAGNMAVHGFDTAFVRRVARDADSLLPYHASAKKIPTIDAEGQPVKPEAPNGYKLERFVFDALPAAKRVSVVEADRDLEYAPVKNAEGGESPLTARRALIERYRRWLQEAGIDLPPPGIAIEIDEALVSGAEDLRALGIRHLDEANDVICTGVGGEA